MIFAIRDDDTSFFTRPEQLEVCYDGVWQTCPVSLSCVPFQACTPTGGIPEKHWVGEDVFPLGDNAELVAFLRQQIHAHRVSISLHGFSHRDEPAGFEFVAGSDLARKVQEGREYLERLLGTRVTVFVPPHNALSRVGWEAVVGQGLSICGGAFGQRGYARRELVPMFRKKWWNLVRRSEYPRPFRYRNHVEINYASVTPSADPAWLANSLDSAVSARGVFCAATHYWEFAAMNDRAQGVTVGELVRSLHGRASRSGTTRFASLDEIAEEFHGGADR